QRRGGDPWRDERLRAPRAGLTYRPGEAGKATGGGPTAGTLPAERRRDCEQAVPDRAGEELRGPEGVRQRLPLGRVPDRLPPRPPGAPPRDARVGERHVRLPADGDVPGERQRAAERHLRRDRELP